MSATGQPPPGDLSLVILTRSQRTARTEALLEAAAVAATAQARRAALEEVAALNLDVVKAVTLSVGRRYRGSPVNLEALSDRVQEVATEAILALDGPPPYDLVVWLTPIVRNAVVEFVRQAADVRQFA